MRGMTMRVKNVQTSVEADAMGDEDSREYPAAVRERGEEKPPAESRANDIWPPCRRQRWMRG